MNLRNKSVSPKTRKHLTSTPTNSKKLPSCVTPCSVILKPLKLKDIENSCRKKDCLSTPKINVEFSTELKNAINERNILTTKTKKRVFQALDEIKSSSENEHRQNKRNKCLHEILTSEQNYVKQLEIIINFFMTPIKTKNLLDSDDFNVVFGNIDSIYNINKELLKSLEKKNDIKQTATAFSKIGPFFKLYSVYACDFKKALSFLSVSI